MKIEKVNDNQIRCILTKEDLEERKINFMELTYGSDKANRLFKDVMQQASFEFGFEADNMPLMIECVPMQSGMVVFVITKVSEPDEITSHLSHITNLLGEDGDTGSDVEELEPDSGVMDRKPPMEIAGASVSIPINSNDSNMLPTIGKALHSLFSEVLNRQNGGQAPAGNDKSPSEERKEAPRQNRLFGFRNMSDLLAAAAALKGFDTGDTALYKSPATGKYYILLYADYLSASAYRSICTIMSDYCEKVYVAEAMEARIDEHYELILAENAIPSLAKVEG